MRNQISQFEEERIEQNEVTEIWEKQKLVNIAELVMGQSPPGSTYNTVGNGMPFLQGKTEFGTIYPKHIKYTTKPMKIGKKGCILFSVRAPVGDINIANMDYCIGRGLASIVLKEGNNLFLFYMLQYKKNEIKKEGSGSIFKAITKASLANFEISLPPLPEQRNITFILSTIQEAIEKTTSVIQATKELKKSMMKHLFTYGPVPITEREKVKLKETEIGEIPEEWKIVKIGNIVKIQGGYAFKSEDYVDKGVKLLKIGNVSFGKTNWDDISFLPEEYIQEYDDYLLKENDLVMPMTRPIVSGGIKSSRIKSNDLPCLLNQRVCRFVALKNKEDLDYLYHIIFNKFFFESISGGALGSHQPNISASKIEKINIPYPDLTNRRKISLVLSVIEIKIEVEKYKKQVLEKLFKSFLDNLMTGKIRVKDLNLQNLNTARLKL